MPSKRNRLATVRRVRAKYEKRTRILKNYLRVLLETQESRIHEGDKRVTDTWLDGEIENTKYLLRMLDALQKYPIETLLSVSIDEIYRMNFGFREERLTRLMCNGTRLTPSEKLKIEIFERSVNG